MATVPKPNTSNSPSKQQYDKSYFKYVAEDDEYECPAGERLTWRMKVEEDGLELDKYWTSNCADCSVKKSCTDGRERRVDRWVHEELIDEMQDRLDSDSAYMRARSETVEHPFGTLKLWMGSAHFLMKGLHSVNTEISLHTLSYNMKRCINLLGVTTLIDALA